MPKLPGVHHRIAVRVMEKAGFQIIREGKHTVMSNGARIIVIPHHNPINAFTMSIAKDTGFTVEEFKAMI